MSNHVSKNNEIKNKNGHESPVEIFVNLKEICQKKLIIFLTSFNCLVLVIKLSCEIYFGSRKLSILPPKFDNIK